MSVVDDILVQCAEHGVIFRPKGDMLRPLLTKGKPPAWLLKRVTDHKDVILQWFRAIREGFAHLDSEDLIDANADAQHDTPPLVGSFGLSSTFSRPSNKVPSTN